MFNYRPATAAIALTLCGLAACKPGQPNTREFATLDRTEAAHSLRNMTSPQTQAFARNILSLDNQQLKEGERGLKVSAICKLLASKGFSIQSDDVLSKDAIQALKLINAAIGSLDTSTINEQTIAAAAALPNSKSFSLFVLAKLTGSNIHKSLCSAPESVQILGKKTVFREALQLATPVFDEMRRGEAISSAELMKRADKSKHYCAAVELIKIALSKGSASLSPQLPDALSVLESRDTRALFDARFIAKCEAHLPALMDDWQSWGGGGNSIKSIYLELTCESRQKDGSIEYPEIINSGLNKHFDKSMPLHEMNSENIFRSFF
jgi:hypothetical protein